MVGEMETKIWTPSIFIEDKITSYLHVNLLPVTTVIAEEQKLLPNFEVKGC